MAPQSSSDIHHTSSASGELVQSNEVKHGFSFPSFLVLACLLNLSWKMKKIGTDTGLGAYYSQLGHMDMEF